MDADAQHDEMMRVLDEVEKAATIPQPSPMPGFGCVEFGDQHYGGLM